MFLVAPVGKAENVVLMECLGFASGAPDEPQEAFIPAFVEETLPIFLLPCQKLLAALRTRIWKSLQFSKCLVWRRLGGILAALVWCGG